MGQLLDMKAKSSYMQNGFTYIEAILYTVIIAILLSTLIPFAWNIIETGSKSSIQQEVSSNARYISERIKKEIRNAGGINSVSASSISLSETNGSTNPTVIAYSSPNITIQQGTGSAILLNSSKTSITNCTFTNNSSISNSTKNISFVFTIQQSANTANSSFKSVLTIESDAEVRNN